MSNPADFGPQAQLARWLACCACGARPCDPAHHPSRGAGGSDGDVVPLCRNCHAAQHAHGVVTFQQKKGVDLLLCSAIMRALVRRRAACNVTDYEIVTAGDRMLAAIRGCGPDPRDLRPAERGR